MQLATSRSAAEVWEFIDAETERRRQQAESAATEQKAAKALPPSKKSWAARPWQCLVSKTMSTHCFTNRQQAGLASIHLRHTSQPTQHRQGIAVPSALTA